MANDPRVEKLRQKWDTAVQKDRPKDALAALLELEKIDPKEPRWSHRAGDVLRRLGQNAEAEKAYERAVERYSQQGFVARAVAMAKTIVGFNPARTDILAKVDPEVARVMHEKAQPPKMPAAAPLKPAKDALDNEVRFEDAERSIELKLLPEEVIEIAEEDIIVDEGPSAEQLAIMAAGALFTEISPAALQKLMDAAELVEKGGGEYVFRKNDPADALYVVVEGAILVRVPAEPAPVGEGQVFGEACLLEEGKRTADVIAHKRLVALRIAKDALDRISAEHPEVEDALLELLVRRLVSNLLLTSELFNAFDPETRISIANMFEVRRAEPGVVLSEKGKRCDALYVLLTGHLEIEGQGPVARGSMFGQHSLITRGAAPETVRAESESIVLRLPAGAFSTLAAHYPPALSYLADLAGRRLKVSDPPPS